MTDFQKITCTKGHCMDEESIDSELDSLFDSKNIVDAIQHDLLKRSI